MAVGAPVAVAVGTAAETTRSFAAMEEVQPILPTIRSNARARKKKMKREAWNRKRPRKTLVSEPENERGIIKRREREEDMVRRS